MWTIACGTPVYRIICHIHFLNSSCSVGIQDHMAQILSHRQHCRSSQQEQDRSSFTAGKLMRSVTCRDLSHWIEVVRYATEASEDVLYSKGQHNLNKSVVWHYKRLTGRAGEMVQLVKCLLCKHEDPPEFHSQHPQKNTGWWPIPNTGEVETDS